MEIEGGKKQRPKVVEEESRKAKQIESAIPKGLALKPQILKR